MFEIESLELLGDTLEITDSWRKSIRIRMAPGETPFTSLTRSYLSSVTIERVTQKSRFLACFPDFAEKIIEKY